MSNVREPRTADCSCVIIKLRDVEIYNKKNHLFLASKGVISI